MAPGPRSAALRPALLPWRRAFVWPRRGRSAGAASGPAPEGEGAERGGGGGGEGGRAAEGGGRGRRGAPRAPPAPRTAVGAPRRAVGPARFAPSFAPRSKRPSAWPPPRQRRGLQGSTGLGTGEPGAPDRGPQRPLGSLRGGSAPVPPPSARGRAGRTPAFSGAGGGEGRRALTPLAGVSAPQPPGGVCASPNNSSVAPSCASFPSSPAPARAPPGSRARNPTRQAPPRPPPAFQCLEVGGEPEAFSGGPSSDLSFCPTPPPQRPQPWGVRDLGRLGAAACSRCPLGRSLQPQGRMWGDHSPNPNCTSSLGCPLPSPGTHSPPRLVPSLQSAPLAFRRTPDPQELPHQMQPG